MLKKDITERQKLHVAAIAFLGSISVVSCATTSDVTPIGNGMYMITAAASPARGGTSGSASMSAKKATEYCATLGLTAVLESVESKNINAVGAGASQVSFRCVEDVREQDIQACYDGFISSINSTYAPELGVSVMSKVMNYSSFDLLADTSKVTPEEAPILQAVGRGIEDCETKAIGSMSSAQASIQEPYLRKTLELIAKLSTGTISYSEYASGMNANEAELGNAQSKLAASDREEARWQAEQRMKAMENMNTEIDRIMSPK